MSATSDTSIENSSPELSSAGSTAVILTLGGIFYAVLSGPAITQRGYPPIDPFWAAMPFLWIVPILLSAVFDTRSIKSRARPLAVYAIATAFFFTGTIFSIVPHFVDPLAMAMMTVVFSPVHLAIAFGLEAFVQAARRLLHRVVKIRPVIRSRLRWFVAVTLLAGSIGAPFMFRKAVLTHSHSNARQDADQAWSERRAEIYIRDLDEREIDGVSVQSDYDRETGLRLHRSFHDFGYGEAYNNRVYELLAERGVPAWSMKAHLVRDEDLIRMLDSDQFTMIKDFPHELTDSIVLFKRGTVVRWGSTSTNSGDGVSIATPSALLGLGSEAEPVFVGRHPKYPRAVFIRSRTSWVGAFHEDGRQLMQACRLQAPQ